MSEVDRPVGMCGPIEEPIATGFHCFRKVFATVLNCEDNAVWAPAFAGRLAVGRMPDRHRLPVVNACSLPVPMFCLKKPLE